jgi:hypothetical protein
MKPAEVRALSLAEHSAFMDYMNDYLKARTNGGN